MTPGADLAAAASASARSATAHAAATRSISSGVLTARIASTQPLDRDELDVGRRRLEARPQGVRHRPSASIATRRAPDARRAAGPTRRAGRSRSRRRRRRAPRACAWIVYRESVRTTTSSAPTRNWPEWPATLSSPSREREPGQPAHVLAAHRRSRRRRPRRPSARGGGASRSGRCARSASAQRRRVGGVGRRREVGARSGSPPVARRGHVTCSRTCASFCSCSASVLRSRARRSPSGMATKYR